MTTTVVTGGCGFLGRHLVRELLARGDRVLVVDDLSTGSREALPDHPHLELRVLSVLDRPAMARAVRGADLVFHLAGVVGMRLATAHRALTYRVSRTGTEHLLACTGDAPVVLMSSSAVYGLHPPLPAAEIDLPPEEENLAYDGGEPGYSIGKRHLEQLGQEASVGGRQVLIIRPFNVAGPGQVSSYGMVLPTFVDRALKGEPLPVYGDGQQTRSFSHVHTFTRALVQLTTTPRAWRAPARAVNLGAGRPVTILELARQVIALTGSSSPVKGIPFEEVFPGFRDAPCRVPDTRLAASLLGDLAWPGLEQIILAVRESLERTRLPRRSARA